MAEAAKANSAGAAGQEGGGEGGVQTNGHTAPDVAVPEGKSGEEGKGGDAEMGDAEAPATVKDGGRGEGQKEERAGQREGGSKGDKKVDGSKDKKVERGRDSDKKADRKRSSRSRSRSRERSKERRRDKDSKKGRDEDRRRGGDSRRDDRRGGDSRRDDRSRRGGDRDRDRRRSRSRSRSRDRDRDRDRKRRSSRSRSRERSPNKEDKRRKKEEGDKGMGGKEEKKEDKPVQSKEQDELEEQMRIRRERVAKWRAEKAAAEEGGNGGAAEGGAGKALSEEEQQQLEIERLNQQGLAQRRAKLTEEDYFGEDDDEPADALPAAAGGPESMQGAGVMAGDKMMVEEELGTSTAKAEPTPAPAAAVAAAEEEEEEDPLDAFMKGVTTEVTKLEKEEKKREVKVVDMESIMAMKVDEESEVKRGKNEGLGFRMEEDDNVPELYSDSDEGEKEFDIKEWLESKNQAKNLRPVDHSKVDYEPFKKAFLRLVPEIANMSEEEIKVYRSSLDGIKVRGKRVPPPIKNWFQCGLNDRTLAVIKKLGWSKPTPIQCQALTVVMSGRDCIGVAKTGSGKTGSYLLPCFRHILDQRPPEEKEGPVAVIFTPARELCIQVFLQAKKFLKHLGIRGCAVYGGAPVADQIAELNKLPQLVVCTPGRMIDMLCANSGKVTNLRRVTYITVDEADRMFDLGFEPQITKIMENARPDAQKVLFSATFPKQMESLAKKHLKNPVEMVVGGRSVVSSTIEHFVELREDSTRFLRTLELLGEWFEQGQILIFVERQEACDALMSSLIKHGYPCMTLHGGMDQADRDTTLADFKNKVTTLLVATSLAARGLDVKDLNLVINYDTPSHYEDYVHRVGRTGRAGNKGTAYTYVNPTQKDLIPDLVKALTSSKRPVPKDLRALNKEIKASKKAGEKVKKGSGFGGKGFKFDEEEAMKKLEAEKKNKRLLLIENGEEVSDDEQDKKDAAEEEARAAEFEEQASNLTTAHAQKVAEYTAKTVEKEANQAFNDLVKKATGGLLLKDLVQQRPAASAAPPIGGLGGAVQSGALVTSDVAARAQAAAAALGLAPAAPVPLGAGGQLSIFGGMPGSQEAARLAALKAAQNLNLGGQSQDQHASEELEINDYPQHARWKVTHKDSILPITEFNDVCVTAKGIFVKPGLQPPAGERKLYLLIEGENAMKVRNAVHQFKKLLQEATMESEEAKRPLFSKYTI